MLSPDSNHLKAKAASAALIVALSGQCPATWAAPASAARHKAGRAAAAGQAKPALAAPAGRKRPAADWYHVNRAYCQFVIDRVDGLVRDKFYAPEAYSRVWTKALARHRKDILACRNLGELAERMNRPIGELKTSHCQFLTANDETYYYLRSLFAAGSGKSGPSCDFTGAITGGVTSAFNQVRYVLDGSPAARAGFAAGDVITAVNGRPYRGQWSFAGLAGSPVPVSVRRNGRDVALTVTPAWQPPFPQYVKAIEESARTIEEDGFRLGYVHLWCGGAPAHDAFEAVISVKLAATDGLVLDLRDGYGGNFFDDLDFFFRPKIAYPELRSRGRKGEVQVSRLVYDRPVVAIINGGVRSGKELLAYALKRSGRALLVGEKTAGAVSAGQLFPLDGRSALYLCVMQGDVGGDNLEGRGVDPDIAVPGSSAYLAGDRQLSEAIARLKEKIAQSRAAGPSPASRPSTGADRKD